MENCPLSVFQALNIQNLVLTLVNVDISAFEKVKFCIVTLSNTKLSKKYINWPLHPCTKRCFRRRGRTNNPCYPLSWSPGCGSPCNLFWWPGTKKSRWHQVPNCSITWLPSFLPVFSAFWVVVCALENSKLSKWKFICFRIWLEARKEVSFTLVLFFQLLVKILVKMMKCLSSWTLEQKVSGKFNHSSSSKDYLAPAKSSYLEVQEWKQEKTVQK